uniref:Copia protein n=1 Tax=Tanacetum cinerariifolium TaxID=118510 RepID=A0A6L2L912_TANCI|nr:copia protein [Tanacetum cinerariifolium]
MKVGLTLCKRNCYSSKSRRQEEGIDYDEFFAPVARIEAIRSVFVTTPGFVDPKFPNKVVKSLYGLHQAPKACSTKKSWCDEFEELMKNRFQMSSMGELTFFLRLQTASTPIETQKPLVKDEEDDDMDVHLYRDAYEKKLIQVLKIHTDDNVADLLTKAFDMGYDCYGDYLGFILFFGMKIEGYKWYLFSVARFGDQPPLTGSSLEHDFSQDPRVNLEGTAGVEGIRVFALKNVKDAQAKEILTLKARIKKLEKRCKPSISHHRAWTARQELSTAGLTSTPTTTKIFDDEEMTLADTLIKLKDDKAKDKWKGVLEEPKSAKKMTRSDFDATQIAKVEEIARQLEVELQVEVERETQREQQAFMNYIANLYDEVQERIDVDHELAVKWTHEEHEKYTVDEREKLLAEYFEKRKKQLAEERAVAIRNKPPTKLN